LWGFRGLFGYLAVIRSIIWGDFARLFAAIRRLLGHWCAGAWRRFVWLFGIGIGKMWCERGWGTAESGEAALFASAQTHFALNPPDMLCIVQNRGVSEVGHEHFALPEVILSRIGQKI